MLGCRVALTYISPMRCSRILPCYGFIVLSRLPEAGKAVLSWGEGSTALLYESLQLWKFISQFSEPLAFPVCLWRARMPGHT